jgi:hypothetical protein
MNMSIQKVDNGGEYSMTSVADPHPVGYVSDLKNK